MTFNTANTGFCMPCMVKMHIRRQRGEALPFQRFSGINGGIRIGCRMQRQQANIVRQNMPVAIHTHRGRRQPGSRPLLCTTVAGLALHIHHMFSRVRMVRKRHYLLHCNRLRRIGMIIHQQRGKHPHCTEKAEGVAKESKSMKQILQLLFLNADLTVRITILRHIEDCLNPGGFYLL